MTSTKAGRTGETMRRRRWETLLCAGLITPAILLAVGVGQAEASQLTVTQFNPYNPATAGSIVPGPLALYTVDVDSIHPTQENEGLTEVGKKAAGFDLDVATGNLTNDLLTDIEPVVIGPGGVLYLTDGHHTFTALEDSVVGASDPTVYVNVIANYSSLTTSQFVATMEANNFLLPINDGVFTPVNASTLAPIPSSLTALTSDPYRGLEYSILKNKSSVLFPTTSNITGKAGSAIPGLDKMTGFYSDFFEADAYRDANGGLGLPYLSPGDIALATNWNLTAVSTTTLPNVSGAVTAAQLPGFILGQNIVNAGGITNASLATGAMDGNGTFTGITSLNVGTVSGPITIGTPNVGFVMQLGNDSAHTVTLNGTNSYTGGTSILAGRLIVQSDAALGAAAVTSATIDTSNLKSSIQAANGIVFNSLTEGNGTLTFGTTTGQTLSTNRAIAVGGEVATIDVNANTLTLNGALYSLGTNSVGIGNATGESDITFDDLTGGGSGKVILTTASPDFYGNVIIGNTGTPTVEVGSDAELGNTSSAAGPVGQVELNGGTLQTVQSFSAPERNLFLGGGSQIDLDASTTSWGTITDIQRTLEIENGSTTAGAITFNAMDIGATSILQLTLPNGGAGETVTFTNGIVRTGADTLILNPTSGTLGSTDKVFSGGASATVTNTIAPAWIVTTTASSGKGPYDFVTYGSNGYVAATYNANTTALNGTTGSEVVKLSANATLSGAASVYALNTNGKTVTIGSGNTLTIGDGTDPAGLILASGTTISGGTLNFGASQGVIWLGSGTPTISSVIAGSGGLVFAGSNSINLSAQETVTGLVTIDSGTVNLTGTNVFAADASGILMDNTKSKPAAATLTVSANNQISSIVQVGNNASITISGGAVLTLGDTTNNLSSSIVGKVTDTTATTGVLTLDGSGLFDFSAGKSGTFALASGSSIIANNSAQLRVAANEFVAGTSVVLNGTSQLQFAQNGGGVFANAVSGAGELHLIGGTLQITGTSNTYSGGTVVELGSTLDVTTNNLPAANPNITDAGGLILFDQNFTGTYSGVISDGHEMGTGPLLSGSLDKDDSTDANGSGTGNLVLANAQTFTGQTYIEAGTITLNAVDTLATSSGVDLGRVGGGSVATLVLGANNTIKALTSETGNTTSVSVGGHTLTINTPSGGSALYGGAVTGSGSLAVGGSGVQGFSGTVSLGSASVSAGTLVVTTGGTFTVSGLTVSGGEFDVSGGDLEATTATVSGGTLELDSGIIDPLSVTVTSGGLVVTGGTLTAASLSFQGGTSEMTGGVLDADSLTVSGGTLSVEGGSVTTNSVTQSGGTLAVSGGAFATGASEISSGTLEVVGGSFSGTTADVDGGALVMTSGTTTFSGATTVSSGTLEVDGGAYTTDGLNVSGGDAYVEGGTADVGDTAVSSGGLSVGGGAFSASSATVSGGSFEAAGGTATISGSTTVSSGTLEVDGGAYTTDGLGVGGGLVEVSSGTLGAGAATVSGGEILVDGGAFGASSNTVSGGTFEVTSGAATISGSTAVSAGTLDVGGGSYSTDGLGVSGGKALVTGGTLDAGAATASGSGVIEVDGGAFNGSSVALSGNAEFLTKGGSTTISGATTLSGGTLLVNGGAYTTDGLSVADGFATVDAGVLEAGTVTTSGGFVVVNGGEFDASSASLTSGGFGIESGSAAIAGSTIIAGGVIIMSGGTYATHGLSVSAGGAAMPGGAFSAGDATLSGGEILVDGGAFTASTNTIDGGEFEVTSGSAAISGSTAISSGSLIVQGGTYTTDGLAITGGEVEVAGGSLSGGVVTLSSGVLKVDGGAFSDNSLDVTGGSLQVSSGSIALATLDLTSGSFDATGGSLDIGTATVDGGALVLTGGTVTATTLALDSGSVEVSGGTLNGGATTVSGGAMLVDGGVFEASAAAITGGTFQITSGSAAISGATTVSGGGLAIDGGTFTTNALVVSGAGEVDVAGGALEATTAKVSGGVLKLESGTIDPLTVTVSSGTFAVTGGVFTASELDVQGGLADLAGGAANVAEVRLTGGTLALAGSTLTATDVTVSGGFLQQTGGAASASTTEVAGGTFVVGGGAYTTTAMAISGGLVGVTGGTLNGGATTVSGGRLVVKSGAFNAGSTTITGGVVDVEAKNAFTSPTVTIGPSGTLEVPGGSSTPGVGTLNNSGLLDIRNGSAANVFTVGAYTGASGGQLAISANLAQGTADRLVVASGSGTTQVVVAPATGAGGPLPFNPAGIPVVVSASAMDPAAFSLAAPVQGGLFQYDLAYNGAANEFVLIGAPSADAFRLASLPTAAQSIWFDTTDSWQDHESDLRGAAGSTPADGASGAPGVWARAVGDWSDRSQTSTYTDLNKSYAFQTGYAQTTGGFFGGFDKDARVGAGEFIGGFGGGYITSTQDFKASPTKVTYQGPSVEFSAAYLLRGFFLEGAFKADFLGMTVSAPTLATFGNSRPTGNETSYGATGDAGYRFDFGRGYIETIASLAYVDSELKGLHLAGTYDSFGDNDALRGRLGVSAGATLKQDSDSVVQGAVNASYWDRLSGGSQATIASGVGAPLLTVVDPQLQRFGEVGVSISATSLKTGWSGFLKGDYQFANGFTGGDVKAGIRFRF